MTCGYGSVSREHTHPANALDIQVLHTAGKTLVQSAFEQADGQQSGVALIHVEYLDVGVANLAQQPRSAQPQNSFLAESVVLVASVEHVRETTVPGGVLRQVRVQKIDGDFVSVYAL